MILTTAIGGTFTTAAARVPFENPLASSDLDDLTVIRFDNSAVTVRGVAGDPSTTAPSAAAPWSNSGPVAWLAYDGDPKAIHSLLYTDPVDGRRVRRRVVLAERIGGSLGWACVRCVLVRRAGTP